MGHDPEEEAARGPRLEGGGEQGVAAWCQGDAQGHAAGVHVHGAGCLLPQTLHTGFPVHLHLSQWEMGGMGRGRGCGSQLYSHGITFSVCPTHRTSHS